MKLKIILLLAVLASTCSALAADFRDVFCQFYSYRSTWIATIYQDGRPYKSIPFYTYGSIEIRFISMPVNHNYKIVFKDAYSWRGGQTNTAWVHGYGWWGWELNPVTVRL